ncbi:MULTISPECIES: OB-fold domain-containing protein [unclassified Mycobacterium]|uniref:Zn-ribbon domain-containing OB-fold protein n=1 Tax=unclassified Mycobacterium TaxID=2642494 RepID=UPI0007FD77E3|nr:MULTISPECIES: OB-fold domain-containing protein [unclassified Mycobacterium]OBB47438.1 DNA-binding protein [Mycobacterium sp. 852002-51961_SCH5331710]OBK81678.1 DNA-binding protein [Mycobacterium sp. 1164985.4]
MSETTPDQPIPLLSEVNRPYWTSGADGRFRLQRCSSCERLVHPPAVRCPHDHGELGYVALSGRGRVETWTVNQHPFFPSFPPPYIIAFVTPVEDERVRVLTNLVNVEPDDVTAGLPVRVTFDPRSDGDDDVFVPLFEPDL